MEKQGKGKPPLQARPEGRIAIFLAGKPLELREHDKATIGLIAQHFLNAGDLNAVYQGIPPILSNQFAFPFVCLERYNELRDDLELVASVGIMETRGRTAGKLAEGTFGSHVIKKGQSFLDLAVTEGTTLENTCLQGSNARSLLCVPLREGSRVLGSITLADLVPREDLRSIQNTLEIIAHHLAQELDRKDTQQKLRESEERFRLAQLSAQVGFWDWDICTNELVCSEGTEAMFGYGPGEFPGTYESFLEQVHPDDRAAVIEAIRACVAERKDYAIDHRIVYPDGTVRWMMERGNVLRDEQGRPRRMLGIVRDITAAKQLEEQRYERVERSMENLAVERDTISRRLQYQEELFKKIIDTIPVMICAFKQTEEVKFVNRAFEKIAGWSNAEVQSLDVMKECYPNPAYRQEIWQYMVSGEPAWRDIRLRTRSGKTLDTSWANVRLSDGSLVGIGIDISERKKTEKILQHSQATLEALSSRLICVQEDERRRIALDLHDSIAASLSAIKFSLERGLAQTQGVPADFSKSLEKMVSLIQNTTEEVRRIMTNLRPSMLDDLGLLATLKAHVREFQARYPTMTVTSTFAVAESEIPLPLKIDMFRVIQEALTNIARHSHATAVLLSVAASDSTITLVIRDNGQGFEVPRSSAATVHGGGFGLSSMRERVRFSGGSFMVESHKAQGATVRAEWPRSHA